MPPILAPLATAAARNEALESAVQSVTKSLGFGSFVFGMTTAQQLNKESQFYFCTSAPAQWVAEYDARSYAEVDPRVAHSWVSLIPLIWDRRIGNGHPEIERFLEDAARYGIGSGVTVALRDDYHARIMLSLNHPERDITAEMSKAWSGRLGDVLLLAVYVHAIFLSSIISKGIPPLQRGTALSPREVQCLQMAAHGLTSADIGIKLGLAERTVNFHFCNIISKLAVANRGEAIALAISRKFISH